MSTPPREVSYKEQLALLKHATVLTGGIHEAQALQLRNYPLLIKGAKKAETKIDTARKMIYYSVTAEKFKKNKEFNKQCEAIVQWVRVVVWDDTTVVFTVNKEVCYDSRTAKS